MTNDVLSTIDPAVLGRELQRARKACRMTQADAAGIIGTARTTVVAIEQGARRIRPGELIKLARAYGRDVSDFVRPTRVATADISFDDIRRELVKQLRRHAKRNKC